MRKILPIIVLCFGCGKKADIPALPHPALTTIPPSVNVRDYGARGDGVTDDTQAFNLAMNAADSQHLPVFVPNGFYKASVFLSHDGLTILGQQQPVAQLTDGTVIIGKINCNNKKNITVTNLGVDSRGQLQPADAGAIVSGYGIDSVPLHQLFNHISLMGGGFFDYMHGILCQTGSDIVIKNITVSRFYHGIAVRASNVVVDSIEAVSCGFTSVVVKSADSYNAHTYNVSVDHVNITGDPKDVYSMGGLVLVQSYEDISKTENITVRNVNSTNGGVACVAVEQAKGTVNNVTISDCSSTGQGDSPVRACYDVSGGSDITFTNCTATRSRGFGFRATGKVSKVRVINSHESNSGAGAWTGTFSYLQLNGVEIVK